MDNKIKQIIDSIDMEKPLTVSQYLALVLVTKGYYSKDTSKENLKNYLKIKTEGNVDNELFSGYMRPFISGVMVEINGINFLTQIDGIYTSDFSTDTNKKLEDILDEDPEVLWDMLENTFDNYVTLHYENNMDNITDNEIVIRLAINEYIIITKNIQSPIIRLFKSTKNIIKNELTAETLKEKLESKGLN